MQAHAFYVPAPGKSEQAKQRLLEAALAIFGEQGPKAATVREIAKAAGQNVAAIDYYFGGKDSLYAAVMEGIVREIRHQLGDVLSEIQAWREADEQSPDEAIRLLKLYFQSVYLRLLSRDDMKSYARLIVREQLQPTAGFEILYTQGFRQIHEMLCALVGAALRHDPREREIIARTHALMGQIYFFVVAREAFLRRIGWRSLEGRNATLVADLVGEHVDLLLRGLAAKHKPSPLHQKLH
jgi:TetR/AcrR family transcriptional regulator, regulator of cefoperazone and chloramphenicol sensitivity